MTRSLPSFRLWLSGLGLLFLWLTTADAAAAQPKCVLIVHSFGSAAPPFTTHSIAFETELTGMLGEQVDLDDISLDTARYADPDMQEALVEYLLKRQAKWRPDLVVPIGSPAGVFIAQYRDRLFPNTPIIYTGMDGRRLPPGTLQTNATFVGEDFDLPGFVEDMLQLAPATTNIALVIGATPLEQFWASAFRQAFEPFTNRVSFTWLNELSFDQMLERVSKLPPRSFIFVILLLRDASGVTHNADEALKRIHEVANAPVNSIFQHQLGLGIVGGRLYQAEREGEESARIAIRVLRGEPASNIPPIIVGPLPPRYDWRELQRWNISEDRLPPGSLVKFRELTAWERYWWLITGTALFCLLQAVLIVSLLINRARRRRGEAEAILIAEVSSKFVNLLPSEVDREIGDAQRRIFEVLDLDVSGFWQWTADASGFFRLTHYSRAGEGPEIPERINSQEYFPWYQQQVLAGQTIAVRSMTELPPEAVRDRETFRQFGFKSNLTIPLSVGGEPPLGALGFNTTRAERDWPDALVRRLQLVAQVFANALARKRADQALRESEERMRISQQVARIGTFDWNIKTGVNIWTPELEAMHGLPPGGFAKTQPAWESLVHSDDRAEAVRRVELACKTGQSATGEWRVIWPDGSVHWLYGRYQVFRDKAGEQERMTGVNIDITERKRTEDALRASELKYRNLVEITGTGYLILDVQGRVLDANQEYVRISGHGELREIIGRSVIEWTAEKAKQRNAEAVAQCAKDGFIRNFVTEYTDASGSSIFVEVNATVEGEGKSARIVSLCRDITERKRAEEALRESEARFSTVANTAPVLIWMSGTDKLCNFFNKSWLDFTGRPLEAELGNGWSEGVHPDDLAKCLKTYGESFEARRPFTMEYQLRRHDGEYRWISDHGVPRYDSERNFLGFIGSCVDITDRKRAEEARRQLFHAGRVSTMGALAGSLAHELNQPLTAILSNAQAGSRFLAEPSVDVAELREVLQDIAQDTKRASDVIRQLRKLIKKDDIQFEALDLNLLIHDSVRLLHSDAVIRKVQIVIDPYGDLPPVRGDGVQLQQVMFNLLLNAFDAMKDVPEGERTVCVRTRQPDSSAIQIEFSDHGPGIHPDRLARLFEPFQTTKRDGLGLGLSISRSIVEAHGGRLWVTNNADRGATFCFTLPLLSAEPKSS